MKSQVNDCLELALCVLKDATARCSAPTSDLRDELTIRSRVKKEGLSFLTITLPSFGRDFERSLADGFVDPARFKGFRKCGAYERGAIPAFLSGMLGQLFHHESGRLLDNADSSKIVQAIRQVCYAFKKIETPCTPARERAAVHNFVQVEQATSCFALDPGDRDAFLRVADTVWSSVLGCLQLSSLVPKHGPGATAEHISGNQKYVWRRWHERLEPYFHFFGDAISISASEDGNLVEKVTFVPVDEEQPVRVVLVPKTLKSPRIIAIEPVCNQYAQQALQRELYALIEGSSLTGGHVNFTDQSVNQRLALMASRTEEYATLDLSDASDRVPYDLALDMFRWHPDLRDAVDACRSRFAELPDGRVIGPLSKFASMGSALCFPVEAMYFYTVCVVALLRARNLPVNLQTIKSVSKLIYVYGDDIIVPTRDAEAVLDHLQKYNCKVNTHKSFWTGKFRESCGVDAYSGNEVTPTYIRQMPPKNRRQAHELASWIATANLFFQRGYVQVASHMYCTCERILGLLPHIGPLSPGLGRVSPNGLRSIGRWNVKYQRAEVRAWVLRPVKRSDGLDGYPALQKCLLRLQDRNPVIGVDTGADHNSASWFSPASQERDHLEHSVRRGAVTLKRRWVPVT